MGYYLAPLRGLLSAFRRF